MTRTRLLLPLGIAAIIGVTGCAGNAATTGAATSSPAPTSSAAAPTTSEPAEAPGGIPSVTPTSTPTSTPSSTASATGPVITTAGYGDLRLGQPVPGSTKLVEWKPKECYDGRWTTPGVSDVKKDPITVRTTKNGKTDPVSFIVVNDKSVQTKSGAHIGTSAAELKKLFPDAKSTAFNDDITLVTVSDSAGQVEFEVEQDAVAGILVLPAGEKPTVFLHGDVFGPCYGA